jgi:hypothetical protein
MIWRYMGNTSCLGLAFLTEFDTIVKRYCGDMELVGMAGMCICICIYSHSYYMFSCRCI